MTNEIIKAVVFESKRWVWVVELKDYKKYLYDNFLYPTRLCVVDTSPDFWDDIQDITNERLEEILKEELWENPLTLYTN